MGKLTRFDEDAKTYTVRRHGRCIIVEGNNPPLEDLQALLRAWDYKEYTWISTALQKAWGCFLVVCRDRGDEALILRRLADEACGLEEDVEEDIASIDPTDRLDGTEGLGGGDD